MVSPIKSPAANHLTHLPVEVLTQVFSHLHEHADFFTLARTSKKLRAVAQETTVLQNHLIHNGLVPAKTSRAAHMHRVLCASAKWPAGLYRTSPLPPEEFAAARAPATERSRPATLPQNAQIVAFSPDSRWFATFERAPSGRSFHLKIWDATDAVKGGQLLTEFKTFADQITVHLSNGGHTALVKYGKEHNAIFLKNGEPNVVSLTDDSSLGSDAIPIGLSPSGRFAVRDSKSAGKWEFWDLRNPSALRHTTEIRPNLGVEPKIVFSDYESSFVATDNDCGVRVDFKPPDKDTEATLFTWPQATPWRSSLTARVGNAVSNDWIKRFDIFVSKPRREATHPEGEPFLHYEPRYSPDGRWAFGYVLTRDHHAVPGTIFKIWDLTDPDDTGRTVCVDNHWGKVQDFDISNDANTIVIRTFEKDLLLLRDKDAEDLTFAMGELPDDKSQRSAWLGSSRSVAVSPSGRLALMHNDRAQEVTFWDMTHGSAVSLMPLQVEELGILASIAFGPNEDEVFISDGFKGVQIGFESGT